MKRPLTAFAALAFIAAPAIAAIPATAAAQEQVTVKVPHSDLNLASPAGQKQLERRLQRAARKICGSNDPRDRIAFTRARSIQRCHAQVMQKAHTAVAERMNAKGHRG